MDHRLDLITAWTDQVADAVASAPDAAVAACPGWSVRDLGSHLHEVHAFWTFILENRPDGPDSYEPAAGPEPAQLAAGLRSQVRMLCTALAEADQSETAWSWAVERTVGFTVRRQTHEALIHLFDAVLAVEGQPAPAVPVGIAADGVDEMFTVMIGGLPPTWTFEPDGVTFRVDAVDADRSWTLGFGAFDGTRRDGTDVKGTAVGPAGTDHPHVVIAGSALDLDLWLWGRADVASLAITGDAAVASRLRQLAGDSLH